MKLFIDKKLFLLYAFLWKVFGRLQRHYGKQRIALFHKWYDVKKISLYEETYKEKKKK